MEGDLNCSRRVPGLPLPLAFRSVAFLLLCVRVLRGGVVSSPKISLWRSSEYVAEVSLFSLAVAVVLVAVVVVEGLSPISRCDPLLDGMNRSLYGDPWPVLPELRFERGGVEDEPFRLERKGEKLIDNRAAALVPTLERISSSPFPQVCAFIFFFCCING